MKGESFDVPPFDRKAIHERIDDLLGLAVRTGGRVCMAGGGYDAVMTEDFLDFG